MSTLVIIGSAKAKPGKAEALRPHPQGASPPDIGRGRLSSLRDERIRGWAELGLHRALGEPPALGSPHALAAVPPLARRGSRNGGILGPVRRPYRSAGHLIFWISDYVSMEEWQ